MKINFKDLLKNRVFISSTILVLILLGWYMIAPIKVKDCSIGNIEYAHRCFNMCSDKIINVKLGQSVLDSAGKPSFTDYKMINNNDPDKYYTRYNIAGHIASLRQYNSIINTFGPDISWYNLLVVLGHYDEAYNYIKNYTFWKTDNYSARLTRINEFCYSYDRRIAILGCRIVAVPVSFIVPKLMPTYNTKEFVKNAKKSINRYKNDSVKIVPTGRNYEVLHNYLNAVDKGQYNIAEKYINDYVQMYKHDNKIIIDLYYKLGLAYMNKGYYAKAIPCFEKILSIRDYDYRTHSKLEICYRKLGNTQKADEHARIMKELMAL